MSSLFKRVTLPLLAVAAAATLCAPAHAATASMVYCAPHGPDAIDEAVELTVSGDSTWTATAFHCLNVGGDGSDTGAVRFGFEYSGPGDFYDSYTITDLTSSTYNCWAVCGGHQDDNTHWYASTGGTYFVNL